MKKNYKLEKFRSGMHYLIVDSTVVDSFNKEGSLVTATFKRDDSEYQFGIPEELLEVLNLDYDANEVFQKLTDGNKRGIIY